MAYVFGFPAEVTRLIEACRDWCLEDVKRAGGTPSCLGLRPFHITRGWDPYWVGCYFISVEPRSRAVEWWTLQRSDGIFRKLGGTAWGERIDNGNGDCFKFNDLGSLVLEKCWGQAVFH